MNETDLWINETAGRENRERFIAKVNAGLKKQKMSKAEFARRCGCSPSNIYTILNGYVAYIPKYIWRTAHHWNLLMEDTDD